MTEENVGKGHELTEPVPVRLVPGEFIRLAAAEGGKSYWEFQMREDGGVNVRYVGALLSIYLKPEVANVVQLHAGRF